VRILLLQAPVSKLSPHSHVSPPLGLAYVAAHLLEAGHRVELIDLNISGFNPKRIELALSRSRPGLVGISAHTETYPNALRLARLVKEFDPSIPVVIGGPHASILPQVVVIEPAVDFIVVGEGERAAVKLAQVLEDGADPAALERVSGLGCKVSDRIVINPADEPLDATEIGRPARHLLSLDFYEDAHNILTARGGCPYRCPFCSASYLWGGKRRPRPPTEIVAEIDHMLTAYGATHVFFVDDVFTLNKKWLEDLLALLKKRAERISWACATRVDLVDAELLGRMAATGCVGIQFGVESGAQSVLDSVKGIDKGRALEAVEASVAAGIKATCSFMVPFPEDTEETLAETLAFMKQLKEAGGQLSMSYTTPYPGTMFFEKADELGLVILSEDWDLYDAKHLVMETKHLSAQRIEEIAESMATELGMSRTA